MFTTAAPYNLQIRPLKIRLYTVFKSKKYLEVLQYVCKGKVQILGLCIHLGQSASMELFNYISDLCQGDEK